MHMQTVKGVRMSGPVCNNPDYPRQAAPHAMTMLNVRMTQSKRALLWLMLVAFAALVTYLGFRGYLSPELLINFSNAFTC